MAEKVGRESPFKGVMEKLSSIEAMVEKVSGLKADIDIDTSDIDKANDELDKFNEKLAEAQKTLQRFNGTGQIRYFATQEKALAHLTKAWEEYKKASSEDDKKSAGRRLMTWAHAYQGAGYSTKDIDKEMFDAADRVYASFKTTGKKGESNSMRMYSKEAFEEIFEAARTAGVDPSESDKYWEKRYYQESKAIHRSAQKAAEQVKVEPVELDVAELFKIDESGLKARMDKLKKSVKKIRDKLIDENGERTDKSLGKNQGAQFLKDLFELDKYNKDTGQLALKGSTKAFKIVLEEMGLKNDLKGDLKPFMSEAQENYNKALEKARRAVKKAGITPKPSSTKENLSEGESTENKSQLQKPMTQSAEDSKAAGKAADDAAKSFQKAAGAAEEAGDKAANSAARTRESAEETRSAAEETAEAAEAANNAQRQMSENSGDNGATQNAREAAAALNEEKEATRGLNDERERGADSSSNDNTAEMARENAAALDEEKKAQQEVNDERSKGSGSSGQDEEPLSYLDSIILKLEEEKKKLKELQEESDKTRKLLDATADTEVLEKVRGIVRGRAYNEKTKEWETFEGFEGNPEALGSLVKRKISEGNMAKAAAYYGEYAKAGGTDKFSDLTGKDITAELAERYKQAAEAIGKNPDELRKALNEVNKKILTQREVVSQIEKEVKTAQKEAAAQRKEQAQQEQVTNTDWQNGLNEQEIEAVEAYIKRMKALQKEAYNETSALAQAMSLLEKIKKRDMSGLMDQFTRADSPSSAMLGKMTNMPVNNQKARNDALRSLNQEEYDRLASQQTEGITKGIGKAVEKAKSETELKWEEFADAFLGTDVFADKTKGLDKHNVMKQFEKYGNTAKEALEEINKQWLSGTLDRSKFSGTSDKFVKEYIDALDAAKEKADAARSANVGDPDVNSLFSSGGTTALTQEQVDALHAEAKAYDELIAKKKEYYGIKEESYEPPEKLLNISYKAGNGRMQVDLSKLLPANQSDFKQLLDIVKLEDSQAAYEDNIKRVNDYINDMIKQAKRWLSKGEGRPWDPQNNPFDQAVAQNFGQMSSSKASGVLKKFQGYSGVLYQSMAKDLRVPKELSQVNADLFEQVKSGALDAIEAVELLRQKMQDFYNPPSTSSSSNASTFAADIKSLEGYSSANDDFVNQLIADVITGQKEYDQAMNELKTHIAQRQEEIRTEEELRAKRVRNAGFGEDVKALENYGYADKDFVQKLTAQVLEGTKEYDDAMDELKTHIEQKHAEMMAAAEKKDSEATRENAAENQANTDAEDLGKDISDVGERAKVARGEVGKFVDSMREAAEEAMKVAKIDGEPELIRKTGENGTSVSATYKLARGMHYTENWRYRNGNEETGEEPEWAMTSAKYVIDYKALLDDTTTAMKAMAQEQAKLALAQAQGRGENVTNPIQAQIDLYQKRIDQNNILAEQYERLRGLEKDNFILDHEYTKKQYDKGVEEAQKLINAQRDAKKEKAVDDEQRRQTAKQDKEVARAQKYATERLVALKQLESSFTTEGSSRYLSAEDDRTAITDMAGKLRTKLKDIIKQNRAMTIDEMDDIITQFGDIKVEGDTRYSRSTAKKGDLSRQKVDSLKNVLSSDLDAFSQQAQRSSGDISHITEEVNKLKEALNGNVSSEFITESFQKLRELRAELKAINEEQRTKTATEKARQAEIKLVTELQESYIKLAEAEEKRDHASTETGRELGRRQSDQIKKRQEELKKRVESTLGKDFANKAVAQAEAEANKLRTAYANDRNEGISTKGLGFGENDDVERTWDTLIAKAQQYQKILYKQQSGGTITVNEAALLQKLGDLYQQAGEKAEKAGEKGQKFNEAVAAAQQAVRDSVISKYSETIGGLTAQNKNMPEAYNKQVEELKNNLEQLKNIDFDTTEWKEMVGNLDAGLNNLRTDASMRPVTDSQKAQLDRQMASWMNSNSGAGEFLGQVQRLRDALSNVRAEDEFNGIQSDFEKVRAAAADAGKTGESFGEGLKKRFKSLGQYLLSFASFYRVIDVFKQAFNTVKQLDDALTEMRKVSDESLSSLQRYQSLSFNIADEVGTTAQQIQQSTADWLRLGESFEEAQKSAKESTILLNVSEFENIDKATEALVSASQAYKDLDKIDIIDKLNNIGNNFSISTDQLATGLQNSAAVLMTQGNDIDEALALLTAGNAITQDISKTSAGITYARTYSNIRVLKTRKQLYRSKTRDGSDRAKTLRIIYKYMDKYYNVSSVRMMRFLYSLGFDKESYINRNGKENWRFKWSSELQESLDFFFYMRNKLKEELVICQ